MSAKPTFKACCRPTVRVRIRLSSVGNLQWSGPTFEPYLARPRLRQHRSFGTGRWKPDRREDIGDDVGSAPVLNLQSLSRANALEDAGLVVDELQGPPRTPCEVRQSLQVWRAWHRRTRHCNGVLHPLVVTGPYLFLSVHVWHLGLRGTRAVAPRTGQ